MQGQAFKPAATLLRGVKCMVFHLTAHAEVYPNGIHFTMASTREMSPLSILINWGTI